MTDKNKLGDEPAYPRWDLKQEEQRSGLTKLERACIDLRIPESGNAELDALIAKAQRRDLAAGRMYEGGATAYGSICAADLLLAELAKE